MRILFLNSEYPPLGGGAGNASACLAAELADLGNEVLLLTSRYRDFPQQEKILTKGGNSYLIKRLPALRRKAERSNALEQGLFMLTAAFYGLPIVKQWQPQVVIAFFGVPCGAAALFWKWRLGVPYIVSLRGGDVPGFRPYDFALYHRLISPLLHGVWRQAKAVVANSNGLKELAHRFDSSVPIEVIPNGVDTEYFQPAANGMQKSNESHAALRLLFVGRVVYQKGLDILFHALGRLRDYAWQLTVVGDGPLRESLNHLAEDLGIADRIKFVGWVNRDELPAIYQQADVFVFPSRHEGMSNVVLEAMASGLPVIASDIAGNQELIISGENGFLIKPEVGSELGEVLEQIMRQPRVLPAMGEKAQHYINQHFSWRKSAEQYVAVIHRLEENS